MIDNLIMYIKNFPHLISFCKKRFKQSWKWFAISSIVSLIMILAIEGFFNFNHTTDIIQARWLLRVAALIIFSIITLSIYLGYRYYVKDYIVMKSFHVSSVTPSIVIAMLALISMFILGLIIAFLKPVNFETSLLSLLYYLVISAIFISISAVMFGLLKYVFKNVDIVFIIISVISFFMVPILFIPKMHLNLLNHILMINPLYYFVHGSAQSVVFGSVSMSNIPYHIYIILFMALMCVINYVLVRHIALDKYRSLSDSEMISNQGNNSYESSKAKDNKKMKGNEGQLTDDSHGLSQSNDDKK